MNVHKNARLTPYSRAELVQRRQAGERGRGVATALGVSLRTVRKWWSLRSRASGSMERWPADSAADRGEAAGKQRSPSRRPRIT